MTLRVLSLALLFGAASAGELTSASWDAAVSGKSVFIKFQAPCKTVLIADVDCTAAGKDLCSKHGVQGYPSLKYGAPDDLKKYEGGRSYDDLKKFAETNLGPQCNPGENIGLCSDKVRASIEKYLKLSATELEAKIQTATDKVAIDVPLMNRAKAQVQKITYFEQMNTAKANKKKKAEL